MFFFVKFTAVVAAICSVTGKQVVEYGIIQTERDRDRDRDRDSNFKANDRYCHYRN